MTLRNPLNAELPVWKFEDGAPISCTEKIKVLNENFLELRQVAIDALEDGVLMGCPEAQMRQLIHQLIDGLPVAFSG